MRSKYIWFLGALMIGCGNAQNIDISGTWYLQELSDGALQKDVRASENTPFVQFEEGKPTVLRVRCVAMKVWLLRIV